MTPKQELLALLEEKQRRWQGRQFYRMFPTEGEYRRELYPKHMDFFSRGAEKPFGLFCAGNGVGKTTAGCYEATCHATGQYPEWWDGHRLDRPNFGVVAGESNENVRDIIQPKLVGRRGSYGTGMIPADLLVGDPVLRPNGGGAIDYCEVRHVPTGGVSRIQFKSYQMGQEAFMGFEADWVWDDEEPPGAIYSEQTQRFRTRKPRLFMTFTPLHGISDVVGMFIPEFAQDFSAEEYEASGRYYVMCSQDEVPHLTDRERQLLIANSLPHEREARQKGIPSIGIGKIFPFEESGFVIPPLEIPRHWHRLYGLDVGITHSTAAEWGAVDRDTDTLYVYSEHCMANTLPPVHAQAIKARGVWVPGVIDPASRGRNPVDGQQLIEVYRKLGLNLKLANNSVEEGIFNLYDRFATGRIKIVNTCSNLIRQLRLYRRDQKGRVVKHDDDCVDAARYLTNTLQYAKPYHDTTLTRPTPMNEETFNLYG